MKRLNQKFNGNNFPMEGKNQFFTGSFRGGKDITDPSRPREVLILCNGPAPNEVPAFRGVPLKGNSCIKTIEDDYQKSLLSQPQNGTFTANYPETDIKALFKLSVLELRENPNDISSHHVLGVIYLNTVSKSNGDGSAYFKNLSRLEKAINHFQKAQELAPNIVAYGKGVEAATEAYRDLSLRYTSY